MSTDAYRGKGYQARSVLTHLHYLFFMILTACLTVPCIICRNLTLPSFKMCSTETVILLQRDQCLWPWNKGFFTLFLFINLFFAKLAKTLSIFLQQNVKSILYFSVIPYFEKILCSVGQEIRYTELFWYYCHCYCHCYPMLSL